MKVKLKFDLAATKQWLFAHGEKVAFGVMVFVFLLFVWGAMRTETLSEANQPDRLQTKANEVKTHVTRSNWSQDRQKSEGVLLVDYDERAKIEPIPPKSFKIVTPFDPPLADEKTMRGRPTLFNPEELRAVGGLSTFSFKGEQENPGGAGKAGEVFKPGPNATLKPQPWIAITGLLPIKKQTEEYTRLFAGAMGGSQDRDLPHYAGVVVERAEIDKANPDKLDWKEVRLDDELQKVEEQWDGVCSDAVPPQFLDDALTYPLGPTVYAPWDDAVTHPKIPLTSGDATPKPQGAARPGNLPAAKDDQGRKPKGGRHRRAADANPIQNPQNQPAADAAESTSSEVEYLLLRVFDFSVDPNKKYRYRVKIELENPNWGLAPFQVQSEADLKDEFLISQEWTQPTEVADIPHGYRVLAGKVLKAGTRNAEPVANVMLTAIDPRTGLEAASPVEISRGSVANALVKSVKVHDPRNKQTTDLTNLDFKTGHTVLDIRGGKSISRKPGVRTVPGEVLLLDPQGNLVVRGELDDEAQYEARKPVEGGSE